jgi:hypothetical protein
MSPEKDITMTETVEVTHKNKLIFTRYLYPKEQVGHSLLIAILDKNVDEALFWTYELYFSKLYDVFDFLLSIYEKFYKDTNPKKLGDYLYELYKDWKSDKTNHAHVGKLVKNLMMRQFCVNTFIEEYMGVKCKRTEKTEEKPKPFLKLPFLPSDVTPYETIHLEKAYKVLEKAYRYPINNSVSNLFSISNVNIKHKYTHHWLYYCLDCPLWCERLDKYGEVFINDEEETVSFENDDEAEDFYSNYGYEPDEQNIKTIEKAIDNCNAKQLSIKDFAQKYGGTIIQKKVKSLELSMASLKI